MPGPGGGLNSGGYSTWETADYGTLFDSSFDFKSTITFIGNLATRIITTFSQFIKVATTPISDLMNSAISRTPSGTMKNLLNLLNVTVSWIKVSLIEIVFYLLFLIPIVKLVKGIFK